MSSTEQTETPTGEVAATARPLETAAGLPGDPLGLGTLGRWVAGHPLVLLYANVPALILPTMHPKIAHVLSEKDRTLNGSVEIDSVQEALRRLISTYEMVIGIVFAGPEGDDVAHGLHELHRPIAGSMPDGSSYHAWNSDVWNWTWGSILKGVLDIGQEFGQFRYPHDRQAAYEAMNELGRRFGVRSLPDRYEDFELYWQQIVDETLEVNPQVEFILSMLEPIKPRALKRLPDAVWKLLMSPVTRPVRVGILIAVPAKFHEQMGMRETAFDRLERRVHATFWRLVPRSVSGRFAPAYFAYRRRQGTVGWRTFYSRETLEANRPEADRLRRAARAA